MISAFWTKFGYSQYISNRLIFAFEVKQHKYISFQNPFFSRILIAAIHTY